jgi:protein-S-isoprenylcysteine O-methyltransferase Ste14
MNHRILPPTWLLLAMLLIVLLHFLAPIAHIVRMPWNLLGLLPLGFGLAVTLAADRAFKQRGTTMHPFKEPTQLVTNGAFRFSRNPMYLGFVSILLGMAILLQSLAPFAVAASFAILMGLLFIRVEERNLQESFGEDWVRYKQRVRKWF